MTVKSSERLNDADIAIINKVPMRAYTMEAPCRGSK